ncbi:Uncharacterized protein Fot_52489 [Forsythia ovata]|uniref:Uncharacterized protein n=1 Tax=Forsythia ovata TaxID=205694 RepID=A0ABD1PKW9_9LAMI
MTSVVIHLVLEEFQQIISDGILTRRCLGAGDQKNLIFYSSSEFRMELTTSVENTKSSSLLPKLGRDAILPMTQAVTPTNSSIRTLNGNCGSTATLDLYRFEKAPIGPKSSHEGLDSFESPLPPAQPPLPLSPPPLPPRKPISPLPPAQGIWKLGTRSMFNLLVLIHYNKQMESPFGEVLSAYLRVKLEIS